jgi:hypothetical protein
MSENKRGTALHQFFSPKTNKFYKLFATDTWPALEISGIKMHCVQGTDPKRSSYEMVRMLGRVRGIVLDTCCGLGYTAIILSRISEVKKVVTFEIDENVLELAALNPHSQELFTSKKIELIRGDVSLGLDNFPENYFSAILHDPPTVKVAGELYSAVFYRKLFRVLKPGCKVFHYTGAPGEKRGIDVRRGVIRRLREAGFVCVKRTEKVRGVLAFKSSTTKPP